MNCKALPLYAAAHFWVDFSCALLLVGRPWGGADMLRVFLLYNLFAFALQLPIGLLADRLGGARWFAAGGCALAALAWGLGGLPAALVAGLGNACFHVGGGLYVLNGSERCGPLGMFVSPGALGIYLGAVVTLPAPVVWGGLLLFSAVVARWGWEAANAPFCPAPKGGLSATIPLLCLFLVVVLRSALGGALQFPWGGRLGLLLALAVALGKAAGGLLADRFGRRWTAWGSLAVAAGGFLCSDWPVFGLLAVFAFQMTMPITLRAAADWLPGAKGMAFGLLTMALYLGALPGLMGAALPGGKAMWALAAAVSLPLLLRGEGRN